MDFSKTDTNNLMEYANNKKAILEKCQGIYEYHKMMLEQNKNKKQTQENKNEKNVDWNDFQLVETIMFDDFKPKNSEVAFNKPLYNKNLE